MYFQWMKQQQLLVLKQKKTERHTHKLKIKGSHKLNQCFG